MNRTLLIVVLVAVGLGGLYLYSVHESPGPVLPVGPSTPVQPSPVPGPVPPAVKETLLYFTQVGCAPCRVMEREMLEPAVSRSVLKFTLKKLDPKTAPDMFTKYQVDGTPTFVIIAADGSEVSRVVGQQDAKEFQSWLDSH